MTSRKITDTRTEELRGLQDRYDKMKERKEREQEKLEEGKRRLEKTQEQIGTMRAGIKPEEEEIMVAASSSSRQARGRRGAISFEAELEQLETAIVEKKDEVEVKTLVIERIVEQREKADEEIQGLK